MQARPPPTLLLLESSLYTLPVVFLQRARLYEMLGFNVQVTALAACM